MKFTKGLLVGSLITTGVLMMYADGNITKNKMMKKGKQVAKKMGML